MKQSIIDKLLIPSSIPTRMIQEKVKKNMYFPIFKTSEKSYVDTFTNEDTKITELVCSDCSHRFSSKERYVNNVVCPNCGNKELNYSPISAPEIDDSLVFSKDIEILLHTGDRGDIRHMHKVHFTDKSAISSRDAFCIREPMVLDSVSVDGENYYVLREYEMYLDLNKKTGEKKLYFFYTYNCIIFGAKEIVNIRDGKKSSAMYSTSYYPYYSYRSRERYFFTDNETLCYLSVYLDGYEIKHPMPDILSGTILNDIYGLDLEGLDNLVKYMKEVKPVSSVTTKRQNLIKSILDRMPTPAPFTTKNESVCYNVVEVNEMTNTMKFEYICPDCEQTVVAELPKYSSYSDPVNYVSCPHCGVLTFRDKLVDIRYLEDSRRVVNIIQDLGDDIVIFDAEYNVSTYGFDLNMTPNPTPASQICVIRKDFDPNNLMGNVTILRRDDYTGKYSMAKTFKNCCYNNRIHIHNTATHFNMNWSGIEKLNDSNLANCFNNIDFLTAYTLLYIRYPVMEKFLKEGYCDIVKNIISTFDWVNSEPNEKYFLDGKDVASALKMSKGCLRLLKKQDKDMLDALPYIQVLYDADKDFCEEDYNYIGKNSVVYYKVAYVAKKFGLSVHQICEYIERVRVAQCVNPSTAMHEWTDYLDACEIIGSDLNDRRVKYPSALRTEHDKVVYKKNIIENKDYEAKFQSVTQEYGKKYSYKTKDFVVTYPKSLNDLFEEGRVLNHCVGTYGDSIKSGECIILFVRKAKEPNTPYYTLEVNPTHKAVTQFAGYSDIAPHHIRHKELIEFVKEWANKYEIAYSGK